jgi:uncharacterized membrane protein
VSEMQHDDGELPSETPTCMPSRGHTHRRADYFRYGVLLATAGFFLAWIPTILHRAFDADEFEHSHAAWCVFRGMLPYKDFFEHHTPWYYYVLRPFFHWFDVAGSAESARHFLLFGRSLSLVLTTLSVFLVSRIGRLWQDGKVGLLAGLFLVSQPIFFEKAIEIRPDVLALPFFVAGLWLLLRGLARSADSTTSVRRCFFAGGLSLGAAIMCTQKMLFVLPGALAGLVIWSLVGRWTEKSLAEPPAKTKVGVFSRMLLTLVFLVSVCVPGGLTWAAFALHHGGGEFITNNFLLNAKWKYIETYQLRRLIETSWPILALCLLGGGISLARFFRSKGRRSGELLLLLILVGLFAGLLVMPSAHGQYYLMSLPLACLFAAQGLLFLVERAQARARPVLLVLALIPLGVLPAHALRSSFRSRNDAQLARLRYVLKNTMPEDVVMDGWQGMGVFRPHAFYYFFLHPETVAMLPGPRLAAYLDALERGAIRPRLIAMDGNLAALGPRFKSFVMRNYMSNDGFLYFRYGFWRPHPGSLLRGVRGF